jgi:AcrR family transcriptional regulator
MADLTHVKFCSGVPRVQRFTVMTAQPAPQQVRRSRGDRQREAIVTAVRELLQERSFADLSVSTISERAGVARSGFYFYFDSKYAVLAVILADAGELLDELTHHFAPREPGETPEAFAKRMVGSAAAVYANDDPVMAACAAARLTDAQIREMMDDFYDGIIDKLITLLEQDSDARPISDDVPALVRTLAAVTSFTLTQDSAFVGRGEDPKRAVDIVEKLWLSAFWGDR